MKDKLDELLDSYVVEGAATDELVNKIVARAETDKKYSAANGNARKRWLHRLTVLGVTALAGYWSGHMATGGTVSQDKTTAIQASVQQRADYLDRMILGPIALNDVEM